MKIVLDATATINLVHGNALAPIVTLPGTEFFIGPIVFSECKSVQLEIQAEISGRRILLLPDDDVDAITYLALLRTHNLGPGETECLAVASLGDEIVCSDDARARRVIAQSLGTSRVIGCLGLLARASQLGVMQVSAAFTAYELMRARGGFLPDISQQQFLDLIAKS